MLAVRWWECSIRSAGIHGGSHSATSQNFFFLIHSKPAKPGSTWFAHEGEAKQWQQLQLKLTTFTPLHDRILVRRVEETETVRGGIIIPDSAKEKPQEGEVISVGKGKSNDEGKVFPLDVKAGDRVLFGKYSGTEIKIDGEEFLIMREEEVLGI